MVRSLLIRGMLVGVLAGLAAFAFASIFGEPQVQHAIDFEERLAALRHEPAEAEVISRGVQRTVGLLLGTVATGVALGGLLALTFAYAYGRIATLSARATAAALSGAAFVAITLVPFTKYPANPPSVGNPDTIDRRTVAYFAMIAITVLALIAAARVRRQLLARSGGGVGAARAGGGGGVGGAGAERAEGDEAGGSGGGVGGGAAWNATVVAGALFIVVIAVAELILPVIHETPAGFPADVLYRFRVASLGINATLWLALGLGFGVAAERLVERDRWAAERRAAAARAVPSGP
jgi:hypothetical protein